MVFDLPSLYDLKLKEKREWMERLDVSQPIANFAQLVPQMAHQLPFELDIFQQQVRLNFFCNPHCSYRSDVVWMSTGFDSTSFVV